MLLMEILQSTRVQSRLVHIPDTIHKKQSLTCHFCYFVSITECFDESEIHEKMSPYPDAFVLCSIMQHAGYTSDIFIARSAKNFLAIRANIEQKWVSIMKFFFHLLLPWSETRWEPVALHSWAFACVAASNVCVLSSAFMRNDESTMIADSSAEL